MSSAAKTSSVRLFVALAGLLTGFVNLLGALVRLLLVAVTALTGLVQRLAASAAQPSKASAPGPVAVARTTSWMPQGGPLAAPFRPTLPAIPVAAVPAVPAPPMPAVRRTAPYGLHVASPVQMVHGEVVRGVPLPLPVPPTRPTFHLPAADHLTRGRSSVEPCQAIDKQNFAEKGAKIVETLAHYGVVGTVQDVLPGPTVTTYEIAPAPGTKVSKVSGLADDIALALASKVRIIAPIPGKNRIGVEMPNDVVVPVALRDLIEDPHFQSFEAALPVVLGRDTVGSPVYADLANMPHIILAGATGSGKSVGLNVMLLSLLYRRTPDELRLLMIDPKVVELAPFDRIPHMLLPVVTDMKQAATALRWAVSEMERRYQLFANAGTRNIAGYNAACGRIERGEQLNPNGQDAPPGKLPYIVIVVDEFADLMMQQGKDVEASVARLAQKARAAGMHVILATQRPSVEVITGDIKANFPSRIAYRVSQKVDSRIILDEQGADQLLGNGDMLVKLGGAECRRVQGPWVSEDEVARVTGYLRSQGAPAYYHAILQTPSAETPNRRANLRVVA